MKIIIGWTGNSSRGLAELLNDWLLRVIQATDPVLINIEEQSSRSDISTRGHDEDIDENYFGILCLTTQNHESHDVIFEAGVMSNLLPPNRLCGLLLDLQASGACRPLQRFPLLDTSKKGMRKLLHTINEAKGSQSISVDVLEDTFNIFWEMFEADTRQLREEASQPERKPEPETTGKQHPALGNTAVMLEMLATVRALEKKLYRSSVEESPVPEAIPEAAKPFQESMVGLIKKMSNSGYSEDDTIEFLKNIGIPDSYARYTVHKTLGTGVHMELHKKKN